jgi:hypothetical protein
MTGRRASAPAGETESEAPRRLWEVLAARTRGWGEVVDPLLKTLLLLGVLFGAYEYFARQQAARVEKSLALVEEWSAAGHRDAWQRVNDRVWPLYAAGAEAIAAVARDREQRALLFGNLGDAVTGRDDDFTSDADRDVDRIFYFFERAAICADQRICDYGVLDTFLGAEAKSFWLYFSRYAERRQAVGYAGYGNWTERFAAGAIRQPVLGVF